MCEGLVPELAGCSRRGQATAARQSATPAKHLSTTPRRLSFSKAAATRSLSLSCLLTACSEACVPGVIATSTLKRGGRERSSLTRMLTCAIWIARASLHSEPTERRRRLSTNHHSTTACPSVAPLSCSRLCISKVGCEAIRCGRCSMRRPTSWLPCSGRGWPWRPQAVPRSETLPSSD